MHKIVCFESPRVVIARSVSDTAISEIASLPGIELIPTPGHTPGCMSVSVNTTKGKAIITGFCCLKENFGPPEGVSEEIMEVTPIVAPGIHLNAVDGFESLLLVKGLADIPIPCHDPSFLNVKSIP